MKIECWDSVTLYDGPTKDSRVLRSYCTDDYSAITSSGSSMLIVFVTDQSVNNGRFSFTWTFSSSSMV